MSELFNSHNANKIFDDYNVECSECQKYWLDQCDGAKPNTTRQCNSYVATKKVDIPQKIVKLEDKVKSLTLLTVFTSIILLFHLLGELI